MITTVNPLYEVAHKSLPALADDHAIASSALVKPLQARLQDFWLLAKADGVWGPKSARALSAFKQFKGIKELGLGPSTAAALVNTDPTHLLPGFQLNGGWASRTVMYVTHYGYHLSTGAGETNIVYFRGLDLDGTWNGNAAFQFNDRSTILVVKDGVPSFMANLLCTVDPGSTDWYVPINPKGCADIKAGCYQSWSVGNHKGQNALIQVADVTVLRGESRTEDTGDDFYIDQHSVGPGQDYNEGDDPGSWSAGCLVRASRWEHDHIFMPQVQADPRERANPGSYKHWTTVIDGDDFLDLLPAM